jgi:hypothetical protein
VAEHAERVDLGDVPHGREDATDVRRVPALEGEVRSREEDAPSSGYLILLKTINHHYIYP